MVKTSGKANCRKHPIDMMVKNAIKTYFSSELLLFYWHKKNLSIRKILLSEINPYLMGNCLLFILFSFKEDYSFKRYLKDIEKVFLLFLVKQWCNIFLFSYFKILYKGLGLRVFFKHITMCHKIKLRSFCRNYKCYESNGA